jgi:3-hydroxybutyryl-CoA dehydrogenase
VSAVLVDDSDGTNAGPVRQEAGIRRVAVIGAGLLGRRLAELCRQAGYSIILEDVLPSRLRGAARAFESFALTTDGAGQVEYASTIEEAVRDADLVIDCVPDELESKLEILSLIDRMAPPRTIIATPTRSLSIADLASCTYRPERCLALQLPSRMLGMDEVSDSPANRPDALKMGDSVNSARVDSVNIISINATNVAVLQSVVQFWRELGFEVSSSLDPQSGDFE